MGLEARLTKLIGEEAQKLALRYHAYHNSLQLEHLRKAKRVKQPLPKEIKIPPHWAVDPKFDPFYVYSHRRQIAHSIARKIRSGSYVPNPPEIKEVKKPSGGTRTLTIYQIPDAAVSLMLYRHLLNKNRHRFSSFAYAYRDDRNVHFAIQDISIELAKTRRAFVAEFDFSKFFDSIDHKYLFAQFSENGFLISKEERALISTFLSETGKGIPQGTSISLFLANLVCWRLDKGLERAGLQFARYADDTLIWATDYQKISRAYDLLTEFSAGAGVPINTKKSKGIRLLCPEDMPSELASRTESVEFLGYAISVDGVAIRKSSVNKIKKQITYILYKHLIQPLRGPRLVAVTIPANNKDVHLLSAILEIRRYLYGNLTEPMIRRYLAGTAAGVVFKGVMSFYPLINDVPQLRELDGWLVSTIHRAIRLRRKLLQGWRLPRGHNFPFNVPRKHIAAKFKTQKVRGKKLLQIPSFYTMYLAISKGVTQLGIAGVRNKTLSEYDY